VRSVASNKSATHARARGAGSFFRLTSTAWNAVHPALRCTCINASLLTRSPGCSTQPVVNGIITWQQVDPSTADSGWKLIATGASGDVLALVADSSTFVVNQCFHGASTWVELENGSTVPLTALTVGAKVAGVDALGRRVFTEVYGFGTAYANRTGDAVSLLCEHGSRLKVSGPHLVMASRTEHDAPRYVPAASLRVGDWLWRRRDDGSNALAASRLLEITLERRLVGFFSPLTRSGTILVNGIAASSYTEYDHDYAHALFSPLRAWRSVFPDARCGHLPAHRRSAWAAAVLSL